jgi:hypothetical protein
MPSTVDALLRAVPQYGVRWVGAIRWGTLPQIRGPGVYLVTSVEDPTELPPRCHPVPLSPAALDELLVRCSVTVDGRPASQATLAARLAACWLPDEPIVYIGKASRSVAGRVSAYYRTPLGARRPHKGGWFVKTLATLDDLWVHVASAEDPERAEQALISAFCVGVSPATLAGLHDQERPLPFANLVWPPGSRKRHGITGAVA